GVVEEGRQARGLPRLRGEARTSAPGRPAAEARRGDARRQPPLGQGRRGRHRRGPPRRGGQHLAVPGVVRGAGHRGGHAVAAVHRQPQPVRRRADAAAADHRGRGVGACRGGPVADQPDGGARPAAGLDGARPQGGVGGDPGRPRGPRQRRRRLRREARDRGRRTLTAPAPRPGGHLDRGAGRHPRRRAHRRAPLHEGAARPRPGHPHVGRAAPRGVPAVAVGAQRVLLLRGLLARLPARGLPAGAPRLRHPPTALRRL
ncbi:MAG: (2E,6Z)-farnesyl diphosphate synthase, partial [uncultured Nocardioidaceae bacterium]